MERCIKGLGGGRVEGRIEERVRRLLAGGGSVEERLKELKVERKGREG